MIDVSPKSYIFANDKHDYKPYKILNYEENYYYSAGSIDAALLRL